MQELTLSTPTLLFSAVSLILLAYTNRFLGYAQLVRTLYAEFKRNSDHVLLGQINNLRRRIHIVRIMQILGTTSLLLCVASMLFIYVGENVLAIWTFGVGLLSMICSLAFSIWEIQISVNAIELHLSDMESIKKDSK